MLLPMAVDGGLQYADIRKSTNARRFVTGYLFGTGIGLLAVLIVP
jgi:uncharacterized membrane protein